ncbi:MAG: hypothetical protein AAB865_01700 [Patescibacteria group bacterium]
MSILLFGLLGCGLSKTLAIIADEGQPRALPDKDACDPDDPESGAVRYYQDHDGDGVGINPGWYCSEPPFSVLGGLDCDDADASRSNGYYVYLDVDNDGYGTDAFNDGLTIPAPNLFICVGDRVPDGYVLVGGDCDDADPSVHDQCVT